MTDGVAASVFLSRRFKDFSSRAQVNQNVQELARALRTVCSEVGVEVVDLEDGSATVQSAYERSTAAVASCDLLIVFLGYSFSKIVREEVDIALARRKGFLAYRLPDTDPATGQPLEVEEAQREFLDSFNGLDRPVIGQLPDAIYNEVFNAHRYARERLKPDLLKALSAAPAVAAIAWGVLTDGAARSAVVQPGSGVLHAAPIGSDGFADPARCQELVRRADITPTTLGFVVPSGEIVHGASCVLVIHRPTRDGYASRDIPMIEPGEVVGAWVQMQQIVVAWSSPSVTRLVRLSRSSGDVLASDQIAGQPLQRVVGIGAGWLGLTGDGDLVCGPGVPSWVSHLRSEVDGRWGDASMGMAGGVPVLLGLVHPSEEQPGPTELLAASILSGGTMEISRTALDDPAQRVFAGEARDAEQGGLKAHVLRADGSWRIDRLVDGGLAESPHLAWR